MNPTLTEALSPADLEKARRDFRRMLRRKRLSPRWIEEHAEELLAQAQVEYAAKLAKGESARSVVGWLVNGAWWRAQDLLEAQGRRAPTSSIEAAFHLVDESEPDPERQALDHDRAATLRRALAELPDRDRRLLALVYFNGESIRAAGRKLGWQKSAADRHHGEALKRLRSLLGDDRSLLSPATLGVATWIATETEGSTALAQATRALLSPANRALAVTAELGSIASQRIADLWRRASPLFDPTAAATSGAGGRALGACGVAVATVLCGVAASGVVPLATPHPHHAEAKAKPFAKKAHVASSARNKISASAMSEEPRAEAPSPASTNTTAHKLHMATQAQGDRRAREVPKDQPTPVAREFGIEADGAPQTTSQPAGTRSSVSPGASRPSTSTPARTTGSPAPESTPTGRSSPKGGTGSAAGSGAEFGL
jgi:RNA polymerase sigma factor (sigma-70 family)